MLKLRQSLKSIHSQRRTLITYSKQSQLYIHPKSNNKNLVSFSKNPESLAIGEFYSSNPENEEITTKNFISENKEFLNKLHELIKKNIGDDFTYAVESASYADQHMPVYDLRVTPNYQRQPDVENTFGFVRIGSDGTILNDSYQVNDLYKLVTSDGPIKVSDYLHEKLVEELD